MLENILRFLLVYQRMNVVRVEGWNSVNIRMPDGTLDSSLLYDPNTEASWERGEYGGTDILVLFSWSGGTKRQLTLIASSRLVSIKSARRTIPLSAQGGSRIRNSQRHR